MRHALPIVLVAGLAVVGCSNGPSSTGTPDGGNGNHPDAGATGTGPAILGHSDCDPLGEGQCGYPFPSDVYLSADPANPGQKRVEFGDATLPMFSHTRMSKAAYEDHDGWSPGVTILANLPGATTTGLPLPDNTNADGHGSDQSGLALSVTTASPTILLDTSTDPPTLVPHWAELDMSTEDDTDRAFMIRPAVRLKDATRYIVAIRHVKDTNGHDLPAPAVFQALRDGTASNDPSVAPRRSLYDDPATGIFALLKKAGIDKTDLQLAWDFTTASRENNTQDMVVMRDKALAALPQDGPDYKILSVDQNPNSYIATRIRGTFRVPFFLTQLDPDGAKLNRGSDGLPAQNGWRDFPFEVQIPVSVAQGTGGAPVLEQGHGLLGDMTEGDGSYFAQFANEKKYVTVAVDLIGMAHDDNGWAQIDASKPAWADDKNDSAAWDDEDFIKKIVTGDIGRFRESVDRQHQGLLNELVAMRLMMGKFRNDPAMQVGSDHHSVVDLSQGVYWRGDSQGGILGATYMALTTDVTRGYLGEPGMPYSVLLNRSVDFGEFFDILQYTYNSARDLQLAMGLLQMQWDRAEPDGYAPYITSNTLPNTPTHYVLMNDALGDHQVTPLGAHVMERALQAKNLKPVVREVWGVDDADEVDDSATADPSAMGDAMTEFDFSLPAAPVSNVPPSPAAGQSQNAFDGEDPHDKVRKTQAAFDQTDTFLRTGVAKSFCTAGGTVDPGQGACTCVPVDGQPDKC